MAVFADILILSITPSTKNPATQAQAAEFFKRREVRQGLLASVATKISIDHNRVMQQVVGGLQHNVAGIEYIAAVGDGKCHLRILFHK